MDIDYKSFKGFLKKKSPNALIGWQKRYFRVIEGKLLVYSEKENDEKVKGHIQFGSISKAVSVEKKIFKFTLEGRDFFLQADDENIKDQWMTVINRLVDENTSSQSVAVNNTPKEELKSTKTNKMDKMDKKTIDLLRNHGFLNTEEKQLSRDFMSKNGIHKIINIKDPRVEERINYGFIFRFDVEKKNFDQRWIFLFSRRPVTNEKYEQIEIPMEDPKEKEALKFDCLYFYRFDEQELSDEIIELRIVDQIRTFDKDGKYIILLEIQGSEVQLAAQIKSERDKWVEVLENSKRTAMEYSLSNNKTLKNMQYLDNILFKEGASKLREKLDEEKAKIIGDTTKIKDYDILTSISSSLKTEIEASAYGCIYCCPPKKELLNHFIENYFSSFLSIYQKYFENKYKDIDNFILLKLALDLYSFEDEMKKLLVVDGNIAKNANMFVQIYMRKTYRSMIDMIIIILKKDFEKRKIKSEKGIFYSNASNEIFSLLTKTFDFAKQYLHKYILAQLLIGINEAIVQYLLGVDCVLTNYTLLIEKEFIIAMGNNCEKFHEYIDMFLLDEVMETKYMSKEEFNESLRTNHLRSCIDLVIKNSVLRFANSVFNDIVQSFEEHFLSLDLKMILITTNDIFTHHNSTMSNSFKAKCLETLLQFTVFFYIKSLLLSIDNSKIVKIEDLINKLHKDKGFLLKAYESLIGKKKTEAHLKIISDIIAFLNMELNDLSLSFISLREYTGESFNLLIAKAFLKLRTDLNEEEKKNACNKCKEVILNYKSKEKKCLGEGFFDQLMEEIKLENDEENIFNQSTERKQNVSKPYIVMLSLDDLLLDKSITEGNESFCGEDIKELSQSNQNQSTNQGTMMQMKQFIRYQSYYFSLKYGCLVRYKTKTDKVFLNKLPIKNILKIIPKSNTCFYLILNDKVDKIVNKAVKFKAESQIQKEKWINDITREMALMINSSKSLLDTGGVVVEIQKRKRIITDLYQLPLIGKDRDYLRNTILKFINQENCFGLQKRKSILLNEKQEEPDAKRKQNYSFYSMSHPQLKKPIETKETMITVPTIINVYWNKFIQVMKQEKVYNNIILIGFILMLIIACIYF